MSQALVKTQGSPPAGLVPRTVDEALAMAKMLAASNLVPEHLRGNPEDVFLIINYGLEVGLPPVAALRSVAVIKGKPAPHADALVALVLSSGQAKYFRRVSSSDKEATYETWRRGDPEARRETFTIHDAKAAGLTSNHNYKAYARKMLEARAKAFLARDVYPDVCHGMYTAEEVETMDEPGESSPMAGEFSDPAANDGAIEAEIVSQELSEHVIIRMAQMRERDEYLALAPERAELTGLARELALQVHAAHKDHLDNDIECMCEGLARSLVESLP